MRIKETIEKPGYFWLPAKPDDKIFGTLSITDGGHIELKLERLLFPWTGVKEVKEIMKPITVKRIVGECGTLDRCYVYQGPLRKSSVSVGRAFIGVIYEEDEVPRFNSLVFSVEGMSGWVGIEGIKFHDEGKDFLRDCHAVSYQPPETPVFNLANEMQLSFIFCSGCRSNRESGIMEVAIRPRVNFKLSSRKAGGWDEFRSVVEKITIFLCFATDQTVALQGIWASSDDLDTKFPIEIYYSSRPNSETVPRDFMSMPFYFTDIRDDFEKIINKWLEAYETFKTAFNLYFDVKTGAHKTTLEWQFLALVHAIEAAHPENSPDKKDWLPLEEKIETFIEPFTDRIGNAEERKTLIDAIVHTRNYLTHYNQQWKSTAAKNEDLWRLYFKIDRCFQLYFCHLMDFSSEAIDRVLKFLDWQQSQIRFIKIEK